MSTAAKYITAWGDSRMAALSGDAQNGGLYTKIAMAFPNYQLRGTVNNVVVGPQSLVSAIPNMWTGVNRNRHSATSGYTIENVEGVIASRVGSAGQADVHVVLVGINNLIGLGDSAATMLTKYASMLDQFHTTSPSARVVAIGEPNTIYSAGAYEAVCATFRAGMPAVVAARSAWANYVASPTNFTAADFGDIDGIHPNAWGLNRIADLAITALKAIPI